MNITLGTDKDYEPVTIGENENQLPHLLIVGGVGTGKTRLVASIIRDLARRGRDTGVVVGGIVYEEHNDSSLFQHTLAAEGLGNRFRVLRGSSATATIAETISSLPSILEGTWLCPHFERTPSGQSALRVIKTAFRIWAIENAKSVEKTTRVFEVADGYNRVATYAQDRDEDITADNVFLNQHPQIIYISTLQTVDSLAYRLGATNANSLVQTYDNLLFLGGHNYPESEGWSSRTGLPVDGFQKIERGLAIVAMHDLRANTWVRKAVILPSLPTMMD